MIKQSDCNNCDKYKCPATNMKPTSYCANWHPPEWKVPLVELALAHPQSLNDALLGFNVKVEDYIK